MCGGFYDIVVFFDCEVFWGVFVLEGGLLVFLTNFIRHKFTLRIFVKHYSGPHKSDNVLRCIFNQTEIPNGQKKVQQGIEGSNRT